VSARNVRKMKTKMKTPRKKNLSRSAFLKRVNDTIKHYDMLHPGDKVLVAVSGGADSVCLLKALFDMRKKLGIDIVVGTLDHGLRGAESKRDAAFVKKFSEKLRFVCVSRKINLKSVLKKNASLEEHAREKRYAFLSETAAANGCNVIATGHTMDDQAETVLMRVINGSSLAGITGIPPVREERGRRLVRPLIRTARRDILEFLKKEALGYAEDSSNTDMKFQRNRTRHEILPFLEKYNPRLKRSLVNLSDILREDLEFSHDQKQRTIQKYTSGSDSGAFARMKLKDILLQHAVLRKELFKELFRKAGGDIKGLTYRHWMDVDYFLRTASKNMSLDLPGGVKVKRTADEIMFVKRSRPSK